MIRAGHRHELEDHPCQDVEHWTEWGVYKRDDGSTTLIGLFLFGKDVAGWKWTTFAQSPRVGFAVSECELGNEGVDKSGRWIVDSFEDRRICEGLFYCLKVQARAVDAKG